MLLSELTGPALDALDRETPFILPVVREVPRGPQIPIGIEWMILSNLLAEVNHTPIVVMPPIHYAASPLDQGRVGTVAASNRTSGDAIVEVLIGILDSGFRRILLLTLEKELLDQTIPSLGELTAAYPTAIFAVAPVAHLLPNISGNVLVQLASTLVPLKAAETTTLSVKGPREIVSRRHDVIPSGPSITESDLQRAAETRAAIISRFRDLCAELSELPVYTQSLEKPFT